MVLKSCEFTEIYHKQNSWFIIVIFHILFVDSMFVIARVISLIIYHFIDLYQAQNIPKTKWLLFIIVHTLIYINCIIREQRKDRFDYLFVSRYIKLDGVCCLFIQSFQNYNGWIWWLSEYPTQTTIPKNWWCVKVVNGIMTLWMLTFTKFYIHVYNLYETESTENTGDEWKHMLVKKSHWKSDHIFLWEYFTKPLKVKKPTTLGSWLFRAV